MGIRSEFAKGYLAGKRGDEGIARREIEREGGREAESRSRRAEERSLRVSQREGETEARVTRHQKSELTMQQFQGGVISRTEARERLRSYGFNTYEADDIIEGKDAKRIGSSKTVRVPTLSSTRQMKVARSHVSSR